MKKNRLVLNGADLQIKNIVDIVNNPELKVELDKTQVGLCKKAFDLVNKERQERITYGVNTGFGPMASYLLGRTQLVDLQYNLIRSHAVGMGEPINPKFVLAAMVVRLNTLLKGYSGVSIELLNILKDFINHRIIPVVPRHGAVGTSGDLVQLAHIALALIGEGEVFLEDKRYSAKQTLTKLGLKPHKLYPKEGLALINGTSAMTGIAAVLCFEAEKLLNLAQSAGAMALEIVNGFEDSIAEELHSVRPHSGQIYVAENLRKLTKDSKLLRVRETFSKSAVLNHDVYHIPDSVQEVYSLRCIPQILGPIVETWREAVRVVTIEMNAVTDNPIINVAKNQFLHGGNFHGDYVANAMDKLKVAMIKLSILSERRTNFFLNKNINKTFPPFLNLNKPGLTLALQGLQFVATSTVADNQTLAFPHNIHSVSTNGDNQDVVSMGTDAALFSAQVIENTYIIQAIEFVTLTQAMEIKQNFADFSASALKLFKEIREVFPKIVEDRVIIDELKMLVAKIKQINL